MYGSFNSFALKRIYIKCFNDRRVVFSVIHMTVNILAFGEYHQVINLLDIYTSFAQSCSTSFQHNKVITLKKNTKKHTVLSQD